MNYTANSKLPQLEQSIFTTMGAMAREHDAVNLSQGFPDFEPDPTLVNLVHDAMLQGYNQYAPMAGIYSLREAIANKMHLLSGMEYSPDTEITVTCGATQAIFTAISAFIHEGDEVILIKPAYDCYEPAINLNGGKVLAIQMQGKDYTIDWEQFRSMITPRTRMVIINTPHNPSGRVFSLEEMKELEKSLAGTDILLLSDEVYEHLVFDSYTHHSAASLPGLAERSLICASFGKTFHTTGWKTGYCVAPAPLMKEFRKVHEFNVFCVNHPVQHALAAYLINPRHYLNLGPFFKAKRNLFLELVEGSRFTFTPSQGTYFQLLDYSNITDEKDTDFAERLIREFGLASIPISVFNKDGLDHKHLRFCFAKRNETLEKAGEILRSI